MVIHFHYVAAKGEHGKASERNAFMERIACKIKEHDMTCLMMDATMILLKLVSFIRSSGVVIDVCAYCPWVTSEGHQGMNSCCIELINCPGFHRLDNLKEQAEVIKLTSWVENGQLKDHPGYGPFLTA